jgi:transcriptional regulator with XRE-family HTH domain
LRYNTLLSKKTDKIIQLLSQVIKQNRVRQYTQEAFAQRLGVARSTVHDLEHAKSSIKIETYIEALVILEIDSLITIPLEESLQQITVDGLKNRNSIKSQEIEDDF